jgi:peroxiredoxin
VTGARSPSTRQVLLGTAAILGAVVLYEAAAPPPPPSVNAPDAIEDGWTGKPAPDFALRTLGGRRVRLSQFRGKTVLVNFWATWCAPCRVEMPWLAALYDRYRGRNFEIIGVAMDDDDRDKVAEFVRETHVAYVILLKDDVVGGAYGGARFLPQSFFVGPDGRILTHTIGMRSKQNIEADIVAALQRGARKDAGS